MSENEKKGLDAGTLRLLLIVGGIALVALAYFFGFSKLNEQTDSYATENTTLEEKVTKLRGMVSRKAEVEADTAQKEADIQAIYARFPSETRTQNIIKMFDQIETDIKGVTFKTENFDMHNIFFKDGAVLENYESMDQPVEDVQDQNGNAVSKPADDKGIKGVVSTANVNFLADYETIKSVVKFINDSADRIVIPNISVTAAEGEKNLDCTMDVNVYTVSGQEGKEYTEPAVDGVQAGKNNPFKVN